MESKIAREAAAAQLKSEQDRAFATEARLNSTIAESRAEVDRLQTQSATNVAPLSACKAARLKIEGAVIAFATKMGYVVVNGDYETVFDQISRSVFEFLDAVKVNGTGVSLSAGFGRVVTALDVLRAENSRLTGVVTALQQQNGTESSASVRAAAAAADQIASLKSERDSLRAKYDVETTQLDGVMGTLVDFARALDYRGALDRGDAGLVREFLQALARTIAECEANAVKARTDLADCVAVKERCASETQKARTDLEDCVAQREKAASLIRQVHEYALKYMSTRDWQNLPYYEQLRGACAQTPVACVRGLVAAAEWFTVNTYSALLHVKFNDAALVVAKVRDDEASGALSKLAIERMHQLGAAMNLRLTDCQKLTAYVEKRVEEDDPSRRPNAPMSDEPSKTPMEWLENVVRSRAEVNVAIGKLEQLVASAYHCQVVGVDPVTKLDTIRTCLEGVYGQMNAANEQLGAAMPVELPDEWKEWRNYGIKVRADYVTHYLTVLKDAIERMRQCFMGHEIDVGDGFKGVSSLGGLVERMCGTVDALADFKSQIQTCMGTLRLDSSGVSSSDAVCQALRRIDRHKPETRERVETAEPYTLPASLLAFMRFTIEKMARTAQFVMDIKLVQRCERVEPQSRTN